MVLSTTRLMGTCMDGEWAYSLAKSSSFLNDRSHIMKTLVEQFAGPSDEGVPSPSVQHTCFRMGSAVLAGMPTIAEVTLYMPNVHNLPFDLKKFGIDNADHTGQPDIFHPVDEPHGIIQATIKRPISRL